MIRSIIIDDEQHCIKSLEMDLIAHCSSIEIIAKCLSAKEGILAIKKLKPDLIFLDVEMPWMNGFEMLEVLGEINFSIIFTTAHDEFAAKAFRISAVDYLLKPIDATDLQEAVRKAKKKLDEGYSLKNVSNLLFNISKSAEEQRIALPQRDGYDFVEVSSIIYCQAEGAYTKIFFGENRNLLISRSLGEIEELLPSEIFQRIHHSTVVNVNHISQFLRTDGGYLVLKTGERISVSKTRKDLLMIRLGLKKD